MRAFLQAICSHFDKELNTNVGELLTDDFNPIYDTDQCRLSTRMVEVWPIKTEMLEGFLCEFSLNRNDFTEAQISFGHQFVNLCEQLGASHKVVTEFLRSLRSREINKNLYDTNYLQATRRAVELADLGNVTKHRITNISISEPYNFQTRTEAHIQVLTEENPYDIATARLCMHYTHGKLNINLYTDHNAHLHNEDEIRSALVREFGICHFTTGF